MKIDSIKNYPVGYVSQNHRLKHDSEHEGYIAGIYRENDEEKSVNRGYSGSFTGKEKAAVNVGDNLLNKIFRSKKFHNTLELGANQSVVAQALISLVVAGGFRPATNLAMASKDDREDSIYAASHAIASAVIGFVVSSIVMYPFTLGLKELKSNPSKYLKGLEKLFGIEEIGRRKIEKSLPYTKLETIAKFIPDTVFLGVPKAMLTIALIPPILKYVFHMEKGKHKAPQGPDANLEKAKYVEKLINKPTLKAFQGGEK